MNFERRAFEVKEINHSKIKETNRKKIIRLLQEEEEITKLDMSRRLNISITTVSTNIMELKEEGFVGDVRSLESTGGRKAMAIKLNEDCMYSLGAALTPDSIKLSLLNLKKKVVDNAVIKHNNESFEDIIELLNNSIDDMLNKHIIGSEKLLGIGVSIPGTVDFENGIIKNCYLLKVKNFNLKERLEHFNVPVYIDNEANLSAYYEFLNKNQSLNNLLYVSITDGLGLGMIVDGKIYRGTNNTSGEMGHMKINIGGELCKCGARGCLEAYVSKNALIESYNKLSSSQINDIDQFEKLYNEGNDISKSILEEYIKVLGVGISNLIMILDPSTVIVGGEINNLIKSNIEELTNEIYKDNLFTNSDNCNVGITDFKNSYLLGAAMMPIEEFLELK